MIGVKDGTVTVLTGTVLTGTVLTGIVCDGVQGAGIGSGIAIPHGRTPAVESLILAAGVAPDAIAFDALDGKPVSLFFLLLGPDSAAGAHVRALGRISRIVRNEAMRDELSHATDAESFLHRLIGAERL